MSRPRPSAATVLVKTIPFLTMANGVGAKLCRMTVLHCALVLAKKFRFSAWQKKYRFYPWQTSPSKSRVGGLRFSSPSSNTILLVLEHAAWQMVRPRGRGKP